MQVRFEKALLDMKYFLGLEVALHTVTEVFFFLIVKPTWHN